MGAALCLVVFISLLCILAAIFEGTKLGRKFFKWFCRTCFGIYY